MKFYVWLILVMIIKTILDEIGIRSIRDRQHDSFEHWPLDNYENIS
jgi:hypothetical protein